MPAPKSDNDRCRVLLIDGNPKAESVLKQLSVAMGFTLITATSAADGEKLAKAISPALIVMASELNDCDGVDLCWRMKQDAELAATPTVFYSNMNSSDTMSAFNVGALDVIPASTGLRRLREDLEQWLSVARIRARAVKAEALISESAETVSKMAQAFGVKHA